MMALHVDLSSDSFILSGLESMQQLPCSYVRVQNDRTYIYTCVNVTPAIQQYHHQYRVHLD